MCDLRTCLESTPRRNLLVMARLQGIAADYHAPKKELIECLHKAVLDPVHIRRRLRSLSAEELAALDFLVAAGGRIELDRFVRRFGPIRPYKPWRKDSPRHPWRNPISPAERLWYLGLVFRATADPGTQVLIVIPDDVLPLLGTQHAPLTTDRPQHPPATVEAADEREAVGQLLQDLALLLSALHRQDVRPLHGRWLAPRYLNDWNRRCACPEDLSAVRSELQSGRLRFVHYLAEAGSLLTLTGTYLKPTPAAWEWLSLPAEEQLSALWQAWPAPGDATQALWRRYRLPGHDDEAPLATARRLVSTLSRCVIDEALPIDSLIAALPSTDRGLAKTDPGTLNLILTGPLSWLGVLAVRQSSARLTAWGTWLLRLAPHPPPPPPTHPFVLEDALTVRLSGRPRTDHLVQLEAWAEWLGPNARGEIYYRLSRESVARALHRGEVLEGLYALLAEGTGRALPLQAQDTLAGWAEEASAITVRLWPVLLVRDPALLRQLSGRRLRAFIRRTLSTRAAVVDGQRLKGLARALRRAGYLPDIQVPGGEPQGAGELGAGSAAYLWATARLWSQLSRHIDLPFRVPSVLLEQLSARLPPEGRVAAESAVEKALERMQQAIDGWTPHPPAGPCLPVEQTIAQVERAVAEGRTLAIAYWTAGRGVLTQRTVEPYRIEWRGDVPYLIAYCQLQNDERVFRLDRIQACEVAPAQTI